MIDHREGYCNPGILDLTLVLETLYWLVHPRKNKQCSNDDVNHAFVRYRASEQRERAHRKIRDYIGDENVYYSKTCYSLDTDVDIDRPRLE